MCVTCVSQNCDKTSTQYCCDHKKAICGWCRSDQHFKCKVQMIVDVKELEYQSMSLGKLIRTTEAQCKQFDLEDDFPRFREAIDGIKKEFEEVKEEINKAVRYKECLKFEEYQAKLDQIKTKVSEKPEIKEVMSCCFMQIGLKQIQIQVQEEKVSDTIKKTNEGFNQESKIPTEDRSKVKELSASQILSRGLFGQRKSKGSSIQEENKSERLLSSHPKKDPEKNNASDNKVNELNHKPSSGLFGPSSKNNESSTYSKPFGSNLFGFIMKDIYSCSTSDVPEHINNVFMNELVQAKEKFTEAHLVTLNLTNTHKSTFQSFVSHCLASKLCYDLIIKNEREDERVVFSEFSSSLKLLLKTPLKTIRLVKFDLTDKELTYLAGLLKSSKIKISLKDCDLLGKRKFGCIGSPLITQEVLIQEGINKIEVL